MKLKQVSLDGLSRLTHTVWIPDGEPAHRLLVIKYCGRYRDGGEGHDDALYIVATAGAAMKAWYAEAVLLDFSELSYRWGDEMAWAFSIGREGLRTECVFPLVILAGPECRDALQSLCPTDFSTKCRETLESALELVTAKRDEFKRCREAEHASWRAQYERRKKNVNIGGDA